MQQIQVLKNHDYDHKELWNTEMGYVLFSRVKLPFTGWEVMIFPANRSGEVIDWSELYVSRDWETPATAMASLKRKRPEYGTRHYY